jgi:integrase
MPKIKLKLMTVKEVEANKGKRFALGSIPGFMCDYKKKARPLYFLRWAIGGGKHKEIYYSNALSLKEAARLAAEDRAKIAIGIDPLEERRQQKAEQEKAKLEAEELALKNAYTLDRLMNDWLTQWKADGGYKHNKTGESDDWKTYKKLTTLKSLPISEIKEDHLAEILRPLYLDHYSTAKKVYTLVKKLFRYAVTNPAITGLNVSPINDRLDALIHTAKKNTSGSTNYASLPFQEIPTLIRYALENETRGHTASSMLLIFSILTAARAESVLYAEWKNIDLDAGIYRVPPDLIKVKDKQRKSPITDEDRIIYLSRQAVDLLRHMPRLTHSEYVFIGRENGKPLSKDAMRSCILKLNQRRIEREGVGFVDPHIKGADGKPRIMTQHATARSGFNTWARDYELGNLKRFDPLVIEKCLLHVTDTKYNGAYNRNTLAKARAEIMQAWGDYCTQGINLADYFQD